MADIGSCIIQVRARVNPDSDANSNSTVYACMCIYASRHTKQAFSCCRRSEPLARLVCSLQRRFFPFMPKTTHTETRTRFPILANESCTHASERERERDSKKERDDDEWHKREWESVNCRKFTHTTAPTDMESVYWEYGGYLMVFVADFVTASWRTLKKWLNYWVR